MKAVLLVAAIALVAPAGVAIAQSGGMKGMDMDKKSMSGTEKAPAMHKAVGIVKKVEVEFQARGKDHVITSVK